MEGIRPDPEAFARGVRRACGEAGSPGLSEFVVKLAEFGAAGSGLGPGFEKGAQSMLSRFAGISVGDDDDVVRRKSLIRRMLPWALAMAGSALALQYGNAWGRHAALTGNDNGPVGGTLKAIMEAATGKKFRYVGKGNVAPNDPYHTRLSNKEYDDLVTYGSSLGPSFFDSIGDIKMKSGDNGHA